MLQSDERREAGSPATIEQFDSAHSVPFDASAEAKEISSSSQSFFHQEVIPPLSHANSKHSHLSANNEVITNQASNHDFSSSSERGGPTTEHNKQLPPGSEESMAMPGHGQASSNDGSVKDGSDDSVNEELQRRFGDSPDVRSPVLLPARNNSGGATGSSEPAKLPRFDVSQVREHSDIVFSPRAEGKAESEFWRTLTNQLLRGKAKEGENAQQSTPPVDDKVACKIVCLSILRRVKHAQSVNSESPLTHPQISMVFDYIFRMLDAYAHELVAAYHMSQELLQDVDAFVDSQRARGAKTSRSLVFVRNKIATSQSDCAERLKAVDLMQKQNLQRKLEFQEAISSQELDLELVQEVVDLNLILQGRLRTAVDKHARYVREGRKMLNKQLGIRCADDDMLFAETQHALEILADADFKRKLSEPSSTIDAAQLDHMRKCHNDSDNPETENPPQTPKKKYAKSWIKNKLKVANTLGNTIFPTKKTTTIHSNSSSPVFEPSSCNSASADNDLLPPCELDNPS